MSIQSDVEMLSLQAVENYARRNNISTIDIPTNGSLYILNQEVKQMSENQFDIDKKFRLL